MDVSIYGVGVSLVNNDMEVRRELAYLGVTSSSIVWEVRREGKQRYKSLTTAQCQVGSSWVRVRHLSSEQFCPGSNIFVPQIFVLKPI